MNGSRAQFWEEARTSSQERTAHALVLKRSDSGENSRRLTLLTQEYGKTDVIAKGAKKPASRLAGSSELLVNAEFTWVEGRHQRFVTHVRPITSYPQLRTDFDRLTAAIAFSEVVAISMPHDSPDEAYYNLAIEVLGHMQSHENPQVVLIWALARLLIEEGHSPDWTRCVETDTKMTTNPALVSAQAGGHICQEMAERYSDTRWISAEALIGLQKIVELEIPPTQMKNAMEALQTLVWFWGAILEKPLKAADTYLKTLSLTDPAV